MVNYGICPPRILTSAKLCRFNYNSNGYYTNGVQLSFRKILIKDQENIDFKVTPLIIYSKFSSKTFIPDTALKEYTVTLKKYLKKHPTTSVYIKGYTDNIGSRETNHWFGMQRAETIRQYLIKHGIPSLSIHAQSNGSKNPIASNNTYKGRAKNRRIEITLK
ncbi:MAG: OmpA family protein [Flavobacteriaceae bacterium]|nr:OmpA family protein [Flavobacteriaceae bacterium]